MESDECAWACCKLGGTRALSPADLDALVAQMNDLFTQKRGISPQEVVAYYRQNAELDIGSCSYCSRIS